MSYLHDVAFTRKSSNEKYSHCRRMFKEKIENIIIINECKVWQYHKMCLFLFELTAIVLEILFGHLLLFRNL